MGLPFVSLNLDFSQSAMGHYTSLGPGGLGVLIVWPPQIHPHPNPLCEARRGSWLALSSSGEKGVQLPSCPQGEPPLSFQGSKTSTVSWAGSGEEEGGPEYLDLT